MSFRLQLAPPAPHRSLLRPACALIGLVGILWPSIAYAVTRNQAKNTVINTVIAGDPNGPFMNAYGLQSPFPSGTVIAEGANGPTLYVTNSPTWIFWLNR